MFKLGIENKNLRCVMKKVLILEYAFCANFTKKAKTKIIRKIDFF